MAQEKSALDGGSSRSLTSFRPGRAASALAWACAAAASVYAAGCGSSRDSHFGNGNNNGNGSGLSGGNNSGNVFGDGGLGGSSSSNGGGGAGGGGLPQQTCDDAGVCTCPNGNTTTISGYVYDPAGKNPLFNVSVYVPDPASPLPNLDTVPIGCGCSQLFPASVLATGYPTDANGFFSIPCAPSGTISLVTQTGKWRMQFDGINVKAGAANTVPNLRLPRNSTEGSLPNIAIATGGADSLECLPLRIGVDASEYVPGAGAGGHIHIYQGENGAGAATTTPAAPLAPNALWDTQADLNSHDVVLLSCEGHETTDTGGGGGGRGTVSAAHQTFLMNYANSGGRVFASHFHYAWFNTGPFSTAPNTLANWTTGAQQIDDTVSFASDVDTTLFNGAAFPEGAALQQWLGKVQALDANGKLQIDFARDNVHAAALLQPPSTEWIKLDSSVTMAPNATQYFSVDMPIGASAEALCGRVVYSDLHVSGGPGAQLPRPNQNVAVDYPGSGGMAGAGGIVPGQCAVRDLIPQEKALEFMFFDLSSCLVPIGKTAPPPPVSVPK
jgi:hypothetical protein